MNNRIIHVLIATVLAFVLAACQPSSDTPKRTIPKPKSKTATATAEPAAPSSQAKRADTVGVDRYANHSDGNEPWREAFIKHLRKQTAYCIENHDRKLSGMSEAQTRQICTCVFEQMIEHADLAALRQAELEDDQEYLSRKMNHYVAECAPDMPH